jgi:hypothetical protein
MEQSLRDDRPRIYNLPQNGLNTGYFAEVALRQRGKRRQCAARRHVACHGQHHGQQATNAWSAQRAKRTCQALDNAVCMIFTPDRNYEGKRPATSLLATIDTTSSISA